MSIISKVGNYELEKTVTPVERTNESITYLQTQLNQLKNQNYVNLIKNGLFESWSNGPTSLPDSFRDAGYLLSYVRNNDGSIGSNYATITTDGSGNGSYFAQLIPENNTLETWLEIGKVLKLPVTAIAKVRTVNPNVQIHISLGAVGIGRDLGDKHSGSGEWEELKIQRVFTGDETQFGVGVGVEAEYNNAQITFDVAEVRLYIGNVALPYQENPLDRALEHVHFQDFDLNNFEFRNIRAECGSSRLYADGVNSNLTKIITFQKPFRKILITKINVMENTLDVDLYNLGIAAAYKTETIFNAHVHCSSIPTVGYIEIEWTAIGVN